MGARVVAADATHVTAQGVAWDLERNLRATLETQRRITSKSGRRYSDDMVTMTGNAAASIALRNAIFRVVPRSYVDRIYAHVRQVAVGTSQTLATRRAAVLDRLGKIGVELPRVLARLGRTGVEDIGLEDLEVLIGLGTAIKSGGQEIDAAFPPVAAAATTAADGKRMKLAAPAREPGEEG